MKKPPPPPSKGRRPKVFVELCAGTGIVSLALAAPPIRRKWPKEVPGVVAIIPRMGAKTGFAKAILRAMGLRMGQGADRYVWCEAEPSCRLTLEVYRSRKVAKAACKVLRGWESEPPREIWTALKAEGELNHVPGEPPDPREVARAILLDRWSFSSRGYKIGYGGPGCPVRTNRASWTTEAKDRAIGINNMVGRIMAGPIVRATILSDAADFEPDENCMVYFDPPYLGTTGYSCEMSREAVLGHARRCSNAGATVCVSEAEPLTDLGWHEVDITGEREGAKRTFSKQRQEWLTMSKPPAWRHSPTLLDLIGGPE